MSRLAAGLVENFLVEYLGEEPAPEAGDKQKDKTRHKSLKDCFEEIVCPTGIRWRTTEDVSTYESIARTIQELGIGG